MGWGVVSPGGLLECSARGAHAAMQQGNRQSIAEPSRWCSPSMSAISVASVMSARTYYEALGLRGAPLCSSRGASSARKPMRSVVRRAYRKASLAVHPDKSNDAAAEAAFVRVREAYRVLSDPTLRARYDDNLYHQLHPAATPTGGMDDRVERMRRDLDKSRPMTNADTLRRDAQARANRFDASRERQRAVEQRREGQRQEKVRVAREALAEEREHAARQQSAARQRAEQRQTRRPHRRAEAMAFLDRVNERSPPPPPFAPAREVARAAGRAARSPRSGGESRRRRRDEVPEHRAPAAAPGSAAPPSPAAAASAAAVPPAAEAPPAGSFETASVHREPVSALVRSVCESERQPTSQRSAGSSVASAVSARRRERQRERMRQRFRVQLEAVLEEEQQEEPQE